VLSLFLTLCGLATLGTGKLHSILAGGKGYHVQGAGARAVGAVLALAFPLSALLRAVLPGVLGESALMFGAAIEIAVTLLTLLAAYVAARRVRQPALGV
jgi:hypothetical protein